MEIMSWIMLKDMTSSKVHISLPGKRFGLAQACDPTSLLWEKRNHLQFDELTLMTREKKNSRGIILDFGFND